MTALDLLDDSYPHGTVEGYDQGCRTNHCPAPITCTIFRTRYVGDWAFRRMVDGGMTAADIVAAETPKPRAVQPVPRARKERAPRVKPAESKRVGGRNAFAWTLKEEHTLKNMHADGATDTEIAAELDRPLSSVTKKRGREFRLPRNRPAPQIKHGTRGGYDMKCRDESCPARPTCGEVGRKYYRELSAKHRRRDGVPDMANGQCRKGHELTPENTFWKNDGRRRCRTCRAIQHAKWNDKRKGQAA